MSPIIHRLHLIRAASRAGNLNANEGLILRELSDRIGDRNTTDGWFIKQEDLAADCGMSRRTAIRTLGRLMQRGLVIADERGRRKSLRLLHRRDQTGSVGQCQRDSANESQPARGSANESQRAVPACHSRQCQRVTLAVPSCHN